MGHALRARQIFDNLFANVRTLHLNHDSTAVSHVGPMNLSQGSGTDWYPAQTPKLSKSSRLVARYNGIHLFVGEWRDLILEPRQSVEIWWWQ